MIFYEITQLLYNIIQFIHKYTVIITFNVKIVLYIKNRCEQVFRVPFFDVMDSIYVQTITVN